MSSMSIKRIEWKLLKSLSANGMVIDCEGNVSEQIDIIIYDALYTPFVFNKDGVKLIPAESVYAVFEAKQDAAQNDNIKYAGQKVETVRRLKRTSTKIVNAGVTTKGELIEVDDICPSLDFCVHEIEHIALMTPDKLTPDTMLKVYAKRGYKVNSWEDTEILRVTQQLHTNVVAYLTPYINEFTIDIIPQSSFSPVLGEYLKDVPVLVKNDMLETIFEITKEGRKHTGISSAVC